MHITVSVAKQTLSLSPNKQTETPDSEYVISTASNGIGAEEGSNKTPLGNFIVEQKIGDNAPIHTNFKGRNPRNIWSNDQKETDAILTRIIRLEGCEQLNNNTWDRYIYIHGTHEEQRLGEPASHGCIRMKNVDILDLFSRIPLGTTLTIVE